MEDKIYYLYHKASPLGLNYLGVTQKNPYKYSGSGKYWLRHIKFHEFTCNNVKTIILFETVNKEELIKMGNYYSELYDIVKSEKWANLVVENGYIPSEEIMRKISDNQKGKKLSEETKQKIRQKAIGRKASEKTKETMSKKQTGNTHMLGKIANEETKEKMSKIRKGKTLSENAKKKLKLKSLNKIIQKDKKDNIIACYCSITEAALVNKIPRQIISKTCRGEQKTAAGYKWEYDGFSKKSLSKKIIDTRSNKIYNSIKECSQDLNIHRNSIGNSLVGRSKSYKYIKFYEE